jgi:hypothetical protein
MEFTPYNVWEIAVLQSFLKFGLLTFQLLDH